MGIGGEHNFNEVISLMELTYSKYYIIHVKGKRKFGVGMVVPGGRMWSNVTHSNTRPFTSLALLAEAGVISRTKDANFLW